MYRRKHIEISKPEESAHKKGIILKTKIKGTIAPSQPGAGKKASFRERRKPRINAALLGVKSTFP